MDWKNKVFVTGGLVIIGLLAGLIYAHEEFNRKPEELLSVSADFETDYKTILNEFIQNESLAAAKYVGKVVSVKGQIRGLKDLQSGKACFVVFGDVYGKATIRCSMDSAYCNTQIEPGSFLQVKGVCIGFNSDDLIGSDLVLNRCVIVN